MQVFADVNIVWLTALLSAVAVVAAGQSKPRARVIFAAGAGARSWPGAVLTSQCAMR